MNALATQLDTIKSAFDVNSRELATLLKTTPSTLSRWETGSSNPPADRLKPVLALNYVATQMQEFLEPDAARIWLYRPNPQLRDLQTPADLIAADRLDEVQRLIERIAAGVYA